MQLSENKNFLNITLLQFRGDITGAINAAYLCLAEISDDPELEPSDLSFIYQRLGELKYLNNEKEVAFEFFEKSLEVNKGSLITELYYAKFLANLCKEYERAIEKCDLILAIVNDPTYVELEDTPSIEFFIENATELKEDCLTALKGFS